MQALTPKHKQIPTFRIGCHRQGTDLPSGSATKHGARHLRSKVDIKDQGFTEKGETAS